MGFTSVRAMATAKEQVTFGELRLDRRWVTGNAMSATRGGVRKSVTTQPLQRMLITMHCVKRVQLRVNAKVESGA